MEERKSVFDVLNAIDVSDHIEDKNGLSYLPWAWAWTEVKKKYPGAFYTIYERQTEFGQVNYFTDGRTCWVKTGVTIEGLEHIESLPVMDYKNASIAYNAIKSTDVNKAIQRSLTKACARHGLGLYVYAGEDLPENGIDQQPKKAETPKSTKKVQEEDFQPAPKKTEPAKNEDVIDEQVVGDIEYLIAKLGEDKRSSVMAWIKDRWGKTDLYALNIDEANRVITILSRRITEEKKSA